MPKQNRVNPYGEIIATAARGTLMGNRGGTLHNAQQEIVRPYKSKRWIICLLTFKGRRRPIMAPGKYTELFFLDEATALAAGHRPCFECRRPAAQAFQAAWTAGRSGNTGDTLVSVSDIDNALHNERLTNAYYARNKRQRTYPAALDSLPNGTFIDYAGEPHLVWEAHLFPWTPTGYLSPRSRPTAAEAVVLTPASTVRALAHGYVPLVHESAEI